MRTTLLLLCVSLAACGGQIGDGTGEDPEGFGHTIIRGPVLQLAVSNVWPHDITSTSARLHFETPTALDVSVTVDRLDVHEPTRTFNETGPRSNIHEVAVSGLSPCGHYRYTIWNLLESASFTDLHLYDVTATFGPSVHADLDWADVTFMTDLPTDLTVQITDLRDRQVSIAADFSTRTAHRVHLDGLQPRTQYKANVYHQLGCYTWTTEFSTATKID